MEKILERLTKVKRRANGSYVACCPVHKDSTPSLGLVSKGGKILINCLAGCTTLEIVESIGLQMSDLFEQIPMEAAETKTKKQYRSLEAIYKAFDNIEGKYLYNWKGEEPYLLQLRYNIDGKKAFCTFYLEDNYWVVGKPVGLTPLYNLNDLETGQTALIVEGEKLVNILKEYKITGVCSLGGSNQAQNTDWFPLVGKKVVIFRDNDDPGVKYQETVKNILNSLGVIPKIVEVDKLGLEKGDDLEQFIALEEGTIAEVRKRIFDCIPKSEKSNTPTSHLKKYLQKVYRGDADNLEIIDFPILTDVSQMFIPGSISVIYSQPGVGKSLLTQQFANSWSMRGLVRVKSLLLESSINTYLLRCLSRASERFDVLKNSFHKNNPQESDRLVNEYIEVLDICGATMTTSDTQFGRKVTDWTPTTVINWMREQIPNNDVVIVDPISRVLGMGKSLIWEDTNRITAQVEEMLSENPHCRIVFVHHPTDIDGNSLGGGAGWGRFCHNLIYMHKDDHESNYEVLTNDGEILTVSLDRYIKIKKCRSGEGLDYKIGIKMADNCLYFTEVGRIIKKLRD